VGLQYLYGVVAQMNLETGGYCHLGRWTLDCIINVSCDMTECSIFCERSRGGQHPLN
jgi:hypothetical protein